MADNHAALTHYSHHSDKPVGDLCRHLKIHLRRKRHIRKILKIHEEDLSFYLVSLLQPLPDLPTGQRGEVEHPHCLGLGGLKLLVNIK